MAALEMASAGDMSRRGIDLHNHTTASDGLLSPAELVDLASRRGIGVLGVTDHDTMAGLSPSLEASDQDASNRLGVLPRKPGRDCINFFLGFLACHELPILYQGRDFERTIRSSSQSKIKPVPFLSTKLLVERYRFSRISNVNSD